MIYAHAGDRWWVQPLTEAPLTEIRVDGRWQTITHLGFEYAVLLVHKSYSPDAQRFTLPAVGDCVWNLTTAKARLARLGQASESARVSGRSVHFSGYDWTVKSGRAGPGPNDFSDGEENVHVDSEGKLHLRITYRDGRWYCAEVINERSLGYGTYRFSIESSVSGMDPNAVLGLFTWNDDPAFAHREIDIEISRWGKSDNNDAQFVVQPSDRVGHIIRYSMVSGKNSMHSFAWSSRSADFESWAANRELIQQHIFSEGITW